MPDKKTLHLASASPRRREILESLGLRFTFAGVDVDEKRLDGEAAEVMALRLAIDKAVAAGPDIRRGAVILAADTVVTLGGAVFGKPVSRQDALNMLAELSGRQHTVVTAVAVLCQDDIRTAVSESAVRFREINPDEAAQYWQSGEPRDKAGAYAIQGKGGLFVESLAGSYSGVVGLPVFETARMLREAGVHVLAPTGT
ncbi:MAG: septum formation inhibitor Maf [Gammaproteobacteria bacterium]|nr:septum formation inhibitor Maf [Gammaproteobacteria bacterium]